MKVVCANTLLLRRPGDSKYHLWIVVTDPSGAPPEVVIASVTTQRRHSDTRVALSPADHAFIQHPWVVHFTDAMRIRVERLVDGVLNAMRDYCAARF